jgi:hypothetical protein
MSSVIFQPLLYDPLGWKPSNSTYHDTYKWRNYRSLSKDKIISAYGQRYQRQLQKQQKLQQAKNFLPSATNEEQIIQQVSLVKNNEENRGATPASNRCSSSKTSSAVNEESPVIVAENKQRPVSTNRVSLFNIERIINRTIVLFRKPPAVQEHRSVHQLLLKVSKKKVSSALKRRSFIGYFLKSCFIFF